jgi:UDP-N-acetylglucosamine--N-acetylmuramyl-(pentapeptide) pyrophosphoryl-undecaprenol N-acetylglucosamine transferase
MKEALQEQAVIGSSQQQAARELRIVVAGAGTGGHLFPGIAVVDRLIHVHAETKPLFVITGRPIEHTVLGERNFETAMISAAGMKGRSGYAKVQSSYLLIKGLFGARRILKTFRPHLVLGMGGYSSAPVILAAWMMGIPRVIHEQNRVPGITNQFLGRFSDRVYVSFPDTIIPGAEDKMRFVGYPVRPEIMRRKEPARPDGKTKSEEPAEKPLTIIVMGGSQGAHSINMAVMDALDHLDNLKAYEFFHQTGPSDEEYVARRYEKMGAKAVVSAFFKDMASLYQKADIAVCRAGAGTLAELAAAGVPAILIPYPHAADDHQSANAEGMAAEGGAYVLMEADMTPEELASLIAYYRHDEEALAQMKMNIEHYAVGDAAGVIAEEILTLAGFSAAGIKKASV